MTRPKRLLCVKIAARGDLLLAGPAFRSLRERHPDARIALLVGKSCADVAEYLPYFDEIRRLDDEALFGAGRAARARAAVDLYRQMRSGFDEVLLFHRDWRFAAVARAARVPVRRGLARGWDAALLTHPYRSAAQGHHVAQYLGMVGEEGGSRPLRGSWHFRLGEREELLRAAAGRGFRADGRTRVALGFGGGNNVKNRTLLKQWPLARYRELADALDREGIEAVWLGDRADGRLLGEPGSGLALAGALSVPETAAVLSECDVAVANDTFLLHLAEALGVPSVGIYGPTDPLEYGPLGSRSRYVWAGESLPCSPCSRDGVIPACPFEHRCMREVSLEAVLAAVLQAVRAGARRSGPPAAPRATRATAE